MMKAILSLLFISNLIYSKEVCIVPKILLETIQITENEKSYPYYIRTNQHSTIDKFYSIFEKYQFKKTKDKMLLDCLNVQNCITITQELISNKITNLDLGLFQVNYNSYKFPINIYFDKQKSEKYACKIIQDKIKLNNGKWSWSVLASYHSMTPKYNKIYMKKLIKNYIKLNKYNIK